MGSPALLLLLQACSRPFPSAAVGPEQVDLKMDLPTSGDVVINEVMSGNESTVMDERSEFDDWVEIHNRSDLAVDLSTWGLADDTNSPDWSFPEGTFIEPGGHVLVWLDDEAEEGSLHATFSLSDEGDEIALFGSAWDANPLLDAWTLGALANDVVTGRFPDGGDLVTTSIRQTPRTPNPVDPGIETDPSDVLFPDDSVIRIDLFISAENMQELRRNGEDYVEASLGFEGAWLSPVGIRLKGGYGSYRSIDQKAGFRLSLDRYLPGQRLRGQESLTLNNMVQDASCVHEMLGMAIFRSANLPASRTGYVELYLNDVYRGLYLNMETPDDQFLETWFTNPNGNLYQGRYGQDFTSYQDLEQDEQGSEDVADRSDLAAAAALLATRPTEERVPDFEALFDAGQVFGMMAGEVLFGHWDGYFYSANNWRVYHDPTTGKMYLIPWDIDQTFGWEGSIDSTWPSLPEWALQVPSLMIRYRLELWDMADHIRNFPLETTAIKAADVIRPYYDRDPYKENSVASMDSGVNATIDFWGYYPDRVVRQLFPDGEPEVDTGE